MFTLSLVELFVECGFTVNTQFSIENLKEKSLIAQRLWLFIFAKLSWVFYKIYVICRKKCFYVEKKYFIEKNINENVKKIYLISEIYFYTETKIQIFIYFLNIYSFCKKKFFDQKNIFVKTSSWTQ